MILYFIQDVRDGDITPNYLAELGIGYAFSRKPRTRSAGRGPGDKSSVVAAQTDQGAKVLYKPEDQTWCQHPKIPTVWFGWWNAEPPTPPALERDEVFPGHELEINGSRWTIPVARRMTTTEEGKISVGSVLPMKATTDGDKVTGGDVLSRYQRLWQISVVVWNVYEGLMEFDKVGLPENYMELAAELIAWNYRLSLAEICELELIRVNDPNHNWQILRMTCDIPTIDEWFKKKEPLTTKETNPGTFLPPA